MPQNKLDQFWYSIKELIDPSLVARHRMSVKDMDEYAHTMRFKSVLDAQGQASKLMVLKKALAWLKDK